MGNQCQCRFYDEQTIQVQLDTPSTTNRTLSHAPLTLQFCSASSQDSMLSLLQAKLTLTVLDSLFLPKNFSIDIKLSAQTEYDISWIGLSSDQRLVSSRWGRLSFQRVGMGLDEQMRGWALSVQSKRSIFVRTERSRLQPQSQFIAGTVRFKVEAIRNNQIDLSYSFKANVFYLKIQDTQFMIGRSACHLTLADPALSPQHLCLTYQQHFWTLNDQDSVNGTWVGRQQLELEEGCQFMVNHSVFRASWAR